MSTRKEPAENENGRTMSQQLQQFGKSFPIVAFVGAAAFLGAGTFIGMKSNLARQARADAAERTGKEVSKVVKEDIKKLSSRELARMNIPNSGMTVGHLAAKAFLYGTALCLGTSALAVVGIAWYLDVRNLNEFSRKMENLVPNFRTKLEDLIGSPLQSVSNVAENKAVPMIRDSVGQAIQKSVPAITNKHEEDELAGLTKKEKKLVQEWTQWLQEQTEDKDRKD